MVSFDVGYLRTKFEWKNVDITKWNLQFQWNKVGEQPTWHTFLIVPSLSTTMP